MKTLIISIKLFLLLTLLTGLLYPILVTVIAQAVFTTNANGSMVSINNRVTGSALIGQQFDSTTYFSSRPSAISYVLMPSGGSNYGLTNAKLKQVIQERKQQFIEFNNLDSLIEIPSEMLFASASGLDPHISKQAALLQMNRIARARNFSEAQKQELARCVENLTEAPQYFVFGKERVNVLLLNIEVDKIK